MPDDTRPAPALDLAALIPVQRVAEPGPELVAPTSSPERLALLWILLGAVAGSAVVAVAFLALLTFLP